MRVIDLENINSAMQNETQFVLRCEEVFHDKISAAAASILSTRQERPVVTLTGPSGSGKTTTALRLEDYLKNLGVKVCVLHMDNFFLPLDRRPPEATDWESPYCVDVDSLIACISQLMDGKEVDIPWYDFKTGSTGGFRPMTGSDSAVVIAEGIHYASGRRRGPFIRVNCGAIPGALLESELFGHEKGAFTGAVRRKLGKFELANHGTIFLDEIGELDKNLQVKLLRVLQQKEFDRVGGEETIHVDVRIIAATNRDLEAMVREGTFRDDLYYRLNVIPIILPPLRDRPDDIPLLVEHFIEKISKENKKAVRGITPDAMQMFMHYRWPGNVRELENVIERVITLMDTDLITTAMLPSYIKGDIAGREVQSLADDTVLPWEEYEKQIIANALRQGTSFNGAAKLLRISHKTVAAKARKYGLV